MKRKIIYLPIETKHRELFGRSLLAFKAVERGYNVFIGARSEIRTLLTKELGGIIIEASIPESKLSRLTSYKKYGHKIANLCEESIIYFDGNEYCERKIGRKALNKTDVILVPGEKNLSDLYEYRPEAKNKLALTGNPRFDTLLPRYRIVYEEMSKKLRNEYGKFLLVNTNFGVVNNHNPKEDYIYSLIESGKIKNKQQEDQFRKYIEYKKTHLNRLKEFLHDISNAELFDNIIIRPHPVENHEMWENWASSYDIKIRGNGSANEWMLASDIVLHTGCTTGIEGLLLDRPIISFVPDEDSDFLNISDKISMSISSADEFFSIVDEISDMKKDIRDFLSPQREKLKRYIDNVVPPLACDRILDVLDGLDLPKVSIPAEIYKEYSPLNFRIKYLKKSVKSFFNKKSQSRSRQKFPDLSYQDLNRPIQLWKQIEDLKQDPKIRLLGDRLALIEP